MLVATIGRRAALTLAAALVAQPPPHAATAASGSVTGDTERRCITTSNPSATIVTCQGYGLTDNRVNGCSADEACVATSAVRNPSKYGPPWKPVSAQEVSDGARAWRSLVAAVDEEPGLTIVERDDKGLYLRATGTSTVPPDGTDDVEFLLRDGQDNDVRLLFRSATRQAVFLYPLQQPVANQESHVKRLASIRRRLGWTEAGLPTDGKSLDAEMMARYKVPTATRWFGLELGGMKVPEEYDD